MTRGTPRVRRGVIGPGQCHGPGPMTRAGPGPMSLATGPGPMAQAADPGGVIISGRFGSETNGPDL